MSEYTKAESERFHVKKRFKERFNIDLTKEKRFWIIEQILRRKATFIEDQSCRVSLWDITIEGQVVRVVFDRNRNEIVTALIPTIVELEPVIEEIKPQVKLKAKSKSIIEGEKFWAEYMHRMTLGSSD